MRIDAGIQCVEWSGCVWRPACTVLLLTAMNMTLLGCGGIHIPTGQPEDFNDDVLGSLMGESKEHVLAKFGPPTHTLVTASGSEEIHHRYTETLMLAPIFFVPVPIGTRDEGGEYCFLLQFDKDDTFVDV